MKQLLINKDSLERNGHSISDGSILLIKATKDNRLAGKTIHAAITTPLDVELGLEALQGSNIRFLITLGRTLKEVIVGNYYTHGDGRYLRLNLFNPSGSGITLEEGQIIASVSFVEPMKILAVEAPKDGFKVVQKKVKSNDAGDIKEEVKLVVKRKRKPRKKKEE